MSSQEDTLKFNYVGVDSVAGISSKELYVRAKLFVVNAFKSAKDVIQLDDAENGILVTKGLIRPYVNGPGSFGGKGYWGYAHFTTKIQVKDGKYKYTISDFNHEGDGKLGSGGDMTNEKPACGTFSMTKKYWHNIKLYVDADIQKFISDLNSAMKSRAATSKDEF